MANLVIVSTVALAMVASAEVSCGASVVPKGAAVHFGPEKKYSGYLVRPSGEGPFAGMIVIHEWWGLNDWIKLQADKLAEAGYVALAIDLFDKTTTDPQEAKQLVGGLNQADATARELAAADYLRFQPYVRKIGSIGWCFGGGQSLNLALHDPKLAAAVIYYGQPVTDPKELEKIKASILGIFGEADQMIPTAKVHAFAEALTAAGVKHEIHTYPNAPHAFANPTRTESHRPKEAEDAWKKTLAFLKRVLS